jgi:hypothetical protein
MMPLVRPRGATEPGAAGGADPQHPPAADHRGRHHERLPALHHAGDDPADPPAEFESGGQASGRALAYLAHEQLGNGFGTLYDVSSILILWFAGRRPWPG